MFRLVGFAGRSRNGGGTRNRLELRSANEDRQKEDELDERERDQHRRLELADGFRLSGHALKTSVTDDTETDGDAHRGETKTKYVHFCL